MGKLGTPHIERVAYICTCKRGLGPHIHWDLFRNEPEKLAHLEPDTPTGEYLIVKKDEPK